MLRLLAGEAARRFGGRAAVVTGSTSLSFADLDRFSDQDPGTEAGLGLGTRPDDPPEDAEESVGRPRAGVDVSIRDGEGRILPDEDQGEVLLRSEAVMSGYVGKSPDHAVFARDGFIRTGDRGYIDHTGRLHLVGRVTGS
ncbi:AMP-binding protein [Nonomuraea sp. M3C6]|uniref:AMP-binding protein n=1 Tax=Nonomuraea marmarensis TaxID=3351344 RepID=A0ABW7A4L0_9ACTN